jgi:hypothetical protein
MLSDVDEDADLDMGTGVGFLRRRVRQWGTVVGVESVEAKNESSVVECLGFREEVGMGE